MIQVLAESGIVFDGTISLGSLAAGAMVVLAVGGAAWTNNRKMALGLQKIEDMEARLGSVETKVDALRIENARRDGMERDISDLKSQVRSLERAGAK